MKIWVWAVDVDNAIELAYECKEYKTLEEAQRKDPNDGERPLWLLFEIEVKEVTE